MSNLYAEPVKPIDIFENLLKYSVNFDPVCKHTRFDCEHTDLGYRWSATVSDDLTKSSSDSVNFRISPELLFKVIANYKSGTLSSNVIVKFQKEMKGEDSEASRVEGDYKDVPLQIEIIVPSPLNPEDTDHKVILLQADQTITPNDINKKRITRLSENVIDNRNRVSEMGNEIEELKQMMVAFEQKCTTLEQKCTTLEQENNTLKTKFNDYYTKAEADDEFDMSGYAVVGTCYTKEESDVKYAFKTDAYNRVESDVRYALKGESYLKAETFNQAQVNALNVTHYTKEECDTKYAPKAV